MLYLIPVCNGSTQPVHNIFTNTFVLLDLSSLAESSQLFCCETPEMFCGLQHLTRLYISIWKMVITIPQHLKVTSCPKIFFTIAEVSKIHKTFTFERQEPEFGHFSSKEKEWKQLSKLLPATFLSIDH